MALLCVLQVVDHDFGRAKDLLTSAITALVHLQDGMVGLGRVIALRNRFMPVWVKRLANNLLGLNAMLVKQQAQLLQSHLHTLMKLRRSGGGTGSQCPFKIVERGQQLVDKGFLLCGGTGLDFLAASPLEILKIGGQAQVQILLFTKFLAEKVGLGGSCQRSLKTSHEGSNENQPL